MDFYNKATMAPIFRGNIAQTSMVHSTIARYQEFRDANKTLKMQGLLIKTLKMQGDVNKTLKFQEECRQEFDIAWTCPWRRDDATPTSDAGGR